MSDYIIYYQYTKDPNAKICNVSIRAESYEKAVELFYARYPKSNYRMADWDAFTKWKEELFVELNKPKPKQTKPGGKLRFSDLSPEDKREVLSLARFQRRISAALKRN